MWETWVQSLGWEDPLEKGMATHSSVLAWRTHMDRGTWRAATHGVAESPTQLSAQSLLSKGLSRVFSRTTVWKHRFFSVLPSLLSICHNSTWLLERPWPQLYGPFVGKAMSLLFKMLSRFVIAFLPRSNHLLISWLQSPSIVILERPKRKSVPAFTFPSSVCH